MYSNTHLASTKRDEKRDTKMSWESTKFGTAEKLSWSRDGEFYSHQYDHVGRDDVIRAGTAFIENGNYSPTVKKLALYFLEPETDMYMRGSTERWYIDAEESVAEALRVLEVVNG